MEFYDCGICGHWHPASWDGDCRDDANRFRTEQLPRGWEEVPMPGSEPVVASMKLPFGLSSRVVFAGPYMNKPDEMYGVKMAAEINLPAKLYVPVRDFGVPSDRHVVLGVLRIMLDKIARGTDVYVGCMGGIGRTGTMLALLVKTLGINEPVDYVRGHYNQHAVETKAQEDYIDKFDVSPLLFEAWKARGTAALVDFTRLFGGRSLLGRG